MSLAVPISLGGRLFPIPRLPLGVTISAYPICKRLTDAGIDERILADQPITEEEMGDLAVLASLAANLVDETIDSQAFLAMAVTPPELFATFYVMRLQCGAWRQREDRDGQGEVTGTIQSPLATSPTSTSTASSPSSSATSTSPRNTGSRTPRSKTGSKSMPASSAKRRRRKPS